LSQVTEILGECALEASQFDQYRLVVFLSIFIFMAIFELVKPRRQLKFSKFRRWFSNILLTFLSSLSAKYILPFTGISAAIFAEKNRIGLFNDVEINPFLSTIFVILIFDMVIYWQHRIFHKIPILWKLHKVHHADPDYDVTTGARFHPIEIMMSMMIKVFIIFALGAPVFAVFLFEAILNGMAMFNHSNVRLPEKLDGVLRKIFVTPDFHRVHHSVRADEHHKNFGFNLSLWDYLYRSYKGQPNEGHEDMAIGLSYLKKESKVISLFGMILIPFTKDK
jgi:sterol desaturase/sphingolipid hydroxylase (fatty acid hydroxylase superfamily)